MRLARRISLALGILACAVFAGDAFFRVRADWERNRYDTQSDHRLIGAALARAVRQAIEHEGVQAATAFLDASGQSEHAARLRWIWLDDGGAVGPEPVVERSALASLRSGDQLSFERDGAGAPLIVTYTATDVPGGRLGAVEISQAMCE